MLALAIVAEGNGACKIAFCRVCLDVCKQNLGSGRRRKVCTRCSPSWKPAKTCLACGVLLKPGAQRHKFCSVKCRTTDARPVRLRKCESCLGSLEPYRKRWCASCAQHRKRSNWKVKQRSRLKIVVTCQQCNQPFRPIEKTKTKYCSHKCSTEGLRLSRRAERLKREQLKPGPHTKIHLNTCACCASPFFHKSKRATACSERCKTELLRAASRKHWAEEKERLTALRGQTACTCKECGGEFLKPYGDKRRSFCSKQCSQKAARRVRKPKERARNQAARLERVDPFRVFDRDGWRCQICHKRTPKRLRGTIHDMAPELDHIVPLARGGEHSYQNTQCACRRCNGRKGATVYGQLTLFAQLGGV